MTRTPSSPPAMTSGMAVPVVPAAGPDDALAALRAERDGNACREPLAASEVVELGRAIEALEKPAAKRRQGTRTDLPEHRGNSPPGSGGKVRDKVADALGVSGRTYEKAT